MPGFALGAARRFWGNMRLRRKMLTVYGLLHQLNGPSRRKERINRAAGIMAMRRLNGEGAPTLSPLGSAAELAALPWSGRQRFHEGAGG